MEDEQLGDDMELIISAWVRGLESLSRDMQNYMVTRILNIQTNSRTYLWLKLLFYGLRKDLSNTGVGLSILPSSLVNASSTSKYSAKSS
jgi:hypothetical protein